MYVHPRFARRGVGRLVLTLCEAAADAEGFTTLELMATLAGEPLYRAYGFAPVEDVVDTSSGTAIPLLRMTKRVAPAAATPSP
jgi:GNAT superfamily N-acetyltransferase